VGCEIATAVGGFQTLCVQNIWKLAFAIGPPEAEHGWPAASHSIGTPSLSLPDHFRGVTKKVVVRE
jgi:hypothetical protein